MQQADLDIAPDPVGTAPVRRVRCLELVAQTYASGGANAVSVDSAARSYVSRLKAKALSSCSACRYPEAGNRRKHCWALRAWARASA